MHEGGTGKEDTRCGCGGDSLNEVDHDVPGCCFARRTDLMYFSLMFRLYFLSLTHDAGNFQRDSGARGETSSSLTHL